MTQEDKDLVLKDMCSRVPYELHLWIKMYEGKSDHFINSHNILSSVNYTRASSPQISIDGGLYDIEGPEYSYGEQYIKPYLRSLSSMTEDEKNELKEYLGAEEVDYTSFGYIEGGTLEDYISSIPYSLCSYVISWLNAHHFDYNGLVLKGLALEAPKGMY